MLIPFDSFLLISNVSPLPSRLLFQLPARSKRLIGRAAPRRDERPRNLATFLLRTFWWCLHLVSFRLLCRGCGFYFFSRFPGKRSRPLGMKASRYLLFHWSVLSPSAFALVAEAAAAFEASLMALNGARASSVFLDSVADGNIPGAYNGTWNSKLLFESPVTFPFLLFIEERNSNSLVLDTWRVGGRRLRSMRQWRFACGRPIFARLRMYTPFMYGRLLTVTTTEHRISYS